MITAKINTLNPAQKRKLYWQMFIAGCIPILLFKLFPGRYLIFFVLAGALIPALRVVFVNESTQRTTQNQSNNQSSSHENNSDQSTSSSQMSVKEALNILGLNTQLSVRDLTEEMVVNAHRQLIQKFHPDRGGNDYLAAKINEAKDFLIKVIRK